VGADSRSYPAGNSYPSTWQDVGFVNFAGGDYHLGATSPYKGKGTNGSDPGANIDALVSAASVQTTAVTTSNSPTTSIQTVSTATTSQSTTTTTTTQTSTTANKIQPPATTAQIVA